MRPAEELRRELRLADARPDLYPDGVLIDRDRLMSLDADLAELFLRPPVDHGRKVAALVRDAERRDRAANDLRPRQAPGPRHLFLIRAGKE